MQASFGGTQQANPDDKYRDNPYSMHPSQIVTAA